MAPSSYLNEEEEEKGEENEVVSTTNGIVLNACFSFLNFFFLSRYSHALLAGFQPPCGGAGKGLGPCDDP